MKSTKRAIYITAYQDGGKVEKLDKYFFYDAANDADFEKAHFYASCYIMAICKFNPSVSARVETVKL